MAEDDLENAGRAHSDPGWVASELDPEKLGEIRASFEKAAATAGEDFGKALNELDRVVARVNPLDLISALSVYHLTTTPGANPEYDRDGIFQHHVELIYAAALRRSFENARPTTSLQEGLPPTLEAAQKVMDAFMTLAASKGPRVETEEAKHRAMVLYHLRIHGAAVRGATYYTHQAEVLSELFEPLDNKIEETLGFRCTALVSWWWAVCTEVEERINTHRELVHEVGKLPVDEEWVEKIKKIYPRLPIEPDEELLKTLAGDAEKRLIFAMMAGDLNLYTVFGFDLEQLKALYPGEIEDEALISVLDAWSLGLGDLADTPLNTLVTANPVLEKPVFCFDESHYLWLLAPAFIQSAFPMLEALLKSDCEILGAYFERRGEYLESAVAERLEAKFPDAEFFRNVHWTDPSDGKSYETDLLAIVGSHAIVVECKGGRAAQQALRGKGRALRNEIDELLVAPAVQAQRLARFLEANPKRHDFKDAQGKTLVVDANQVREVITLSTTLETLTTMLPRLNDVAGAGLTGGDLEALTYSLSLFDLMVMLEMLEHPSEVLHYLKRRGEIENGRFLMGQENDLLGFYLKTGLNLGEAEFDEEEPEMQVLGLSNEIDIYHYSIEAGIEVEKPRMRRTSWWKQLLGKVESRLGPHWSEIGVALCNVAYEEQQEFESSMEELQKRFAETGNPEFVFFANGPEARRDHFLGVIVTESDAESRQKQVDNAARVAFSESPEVDRFIVVGWPPVERGAPYTVLAVFSRVPE